jgi:hypothetical protein
MKIECPICNKSHDTNLNIVCPTCYPNIYREEKGGKIKIEEDILNKEVGTIAIESLKPGKVVVSAIKTIEKQKKNSEDKLYMVGVICKHPDKEETIELSNAKFFANENTLKVSALWINKDDDGNLQKGSTAAEVLNYYKVKTFGELVGKEIETVTQSENNKYLCIRLY